MSKIYMASKRVTGTEIGDTINREHLYLVYDPNDVVDGIEVSKLAYGVTGFASACAY